ncbi:TPA: LPP20 family lipoprotein [Photobacterium damselae]
MNNNSVWLLGAVLFVAGCSGSNNVGFSSPSSSSYGSQVITAVGYASISDQQGRNDDEKRIRAMRASKIDAYRELAEQVYGVRISARAAMEDQQLGLEVANGATDGVIRGAKVIRSYPVGDSYVTEMELDLKLMETMKDHGQIIHVPAQTQTIF